MALFNQTRDYPINALIDGITYQARFNYPVVNSTNRKIRLMLSSSVPIEGYSYLSINGMRFSSVDGMGTPTPTPTPTPAPAPTEIAPSGAWNGTMGSGGTAPTQTGTANNNDPLSGYMTTVAAIGNIINPPTYYYPIVADEDVHVFAHAEGGIASVDFWYEGTTVSVSSPAIRDVSYGQRTEKLSVYSIRLDHSAHALDGATALYATIKAVDAGIADRVVGPMLYRRKTGAQWHEIRIRPGAGTDVAGDTYFGPTALQKAHTWWRGAGTNPSQPDVWVWMDEAFVHDPVTYGTWNINGDRQGTFLIKPKTGGSFTMSSSVATDQPASTGINFRTNGLRIEGATFDMSRMTGLAKTASDRPWLLIDCDVVGSGRGELFGATGRLTGANADRYNRNANAFATGSVQAYGCRIHDIRGEFSSTTRNILNTYDRTSNDVSQPPSAGGTLILCPLVNDLLIADLTARVPHLTIWHSGVGGAATYSVSGSANTVSRVLTLRVGGSVVQTITPSVTPGTAPYTFADVAAAINAQTGTTGFTATAVADTLRFAAIEGITSVANAAISTNSAAPTNIVAWLDIHLDLFQLVDGISFDNVVFYGAKWNDEEDNAQLIFPKNTTGTARNVLIANNSITTGTDIETYSEAQSQMWGNMRHFCMVHNTMPNQSFLIRDAGTTFDAYCRIGGNAFRRLSTSDTLPGSLKLTDNHWIDGRTDALASIGQWDDNGTTRSGNTTGGTVGTLFTNWATLGLNPTGTLPTGSRYYPVDISGNARPSTTYKGSVSGETVAVTGASTNFSLSTNSQYIAVLAF